MRIFQWMGLFNGALVGVALLCMGCTSAVVGGGGEKTDQGSLADTPVDPGCGGGGKSEPPQDSCQVFGIGDGTTCQGDLATLKQQTSDACTQAGLVLTDVQLASEGCSADQFTKASYTCCASWPAPPPPESCQVLGIGDGATCQGDLTTLKQQAVDGCSQAGLVIHDLEVATDGCSGDQFTKASYTCCEP